MNPEIISKKLEELNFNFAKIEDEGLSKSIHILFQIIEELSAENKKLKSKLQDAVDEINRLKGEQGKPDIKPTKKKNQDYSSESERKKRKRHKKKKSKSKKHKIKIDREEICKIDKSILPIDAEFKGYQSVVVQEIEIKTNNVEYKKEVYYSRSQKMTYIADLPFGVKGEFGPGIKSLVIAMKHICNMSESKIEEFFKNFGIFISQSTISRILTKGEDIEIFHQEKAEIFKAGLSSTIYQQIDDTTTRVNGQNQYVQIICNPYYTAYFTVEHKDRLTILDILQFGQSRQYNFNEEAFDLLKTFGVSNKLIDQLRQEVFGQTLNEEQMEELLGRVFPNPGKGKIRRTRIMEAAAIANYHNQNEMQVKVLICDDAPQFKLLTFELALCWIHEGRHYKKLSPITPFYQEVLEEFQNKFWDYYSELLKYKENPSQKRAEELSVEFDELFSTQTGYPDLDERIAKTKTKKAELLLVLKYPQLPLHNNRAELGARAEKCKQDVSLHTITEEGTKSKDTLLTIAETAKKLGVSAYDFIFDRVSKKFEMPSLATVIQLQNNKVCYDTS